MSDRKFTRNAEFIEIWNAAGDPQEVAEKTGLSRHRVKNRASDLRKKGFSLQNFRSIPGKYSPHIPNPAELKERMAQVRPKGMAQDLIDERAADYPTYQDKDYFDSI